MKTDLEELYRPLVGTLLLGIILAAAFNIYMGRNIGRDEAFSELYFNDDGGLPKDMLINSTYNVSFKFTNHELETETYVYEVYSEAMNQSQELTLDVGESATITLEVKPQAETWDMTWYVDSEKIEKHGGFGNSTVTRMFNTTEFGDILHENTTIEELRTKPINTHTETSTSIENKTTYTRTDQTLKTDGRNIILETAKRTMQETITRKPFIITIRKENDNEKRQEIYFLYETR